MAESLGKLKTDLGERSLYDAASQCSRCGYCEQACPTYKATGDEKKSPRGRNQLVRLMLEGKLPDKQAAAEALDTCLLCSACSTACYAHVPTADLVLEGRRMLAERRPRAARALSWLAMRPRILSPLLKFAYALKRLGISRLSRPLLRLAGLPGLAEADAHLDRVPARFSHELLKKGADKPDYLQFMPCGTRYVFPEVAVATEKALGRRGACAPLDTGCCGLLAYNYGELKDAREAAKATIEAAGAAETPIVVDCSSCAAFLKTYEQLFLDDAEWRGKAKAFSARVKDAVEVFDAPVEWKGEKAATYHESCRACHGQGVRTPAKLMGSSEEFRRLSDGEACCGGAGAFAFTQPELSEEILKKKIARIADTQARVVVTSSTSCLIQLRRGLKDYYPSCVVKHVSEVAS